jgi:thioredoxin-related protein
MKKSAVCVVFVTSIIFPTSLRAKTWKEAGSTRSLEGEYFKTDGDNVVITRPNHTTVSIPLSKLTDEDKQFVAAQATTAKPEAGAADVFKWETDLEVAKKRAKDEHKTILADFTGSDWCGWCIKLKKEVFDQPEFQDYAKKHLVMLELDFPRTKELLPKEKEQNEKLSEEFKVNGFPSVLLLNAKGKEIGRTGYQAGGPKKYVEHLKALIK